MKTAQTLLVRTPLQHPEESPLGFILRVSEMNGYETPRHLFALAKIRRNRTFTVGLDMAKVAQILGRAPDTLIGYQAADETDVSRVELCGHTLNARNLDLWTPKLCPECIQEQGYVPAWTDLKLVDACPVHRRMLITACPSCGSSLSWFRSGVLRCQCGAELDNAKGAAINFEHAALLSQVIAKLTKRPTDNPCGMPIAQFETMTLRSMLGLMQSMARLTRATNPEAMTSIAARAGWALSQWPNNLFMLLRKLVPAGAAGQGVVVMRRYIECIYRSILRDITAAEDIAFLREMVVAFSRTLQSRDVGSLGEETLILGPVQNAEVNTKPLKGSRPGASKKRRVTKYPEGQRSYGQRDAARRLGIPVTVLQALRRSGHFEVRHTASRVVAFHEADLLAFEEKVAKLHAKIAPQDAETLSLEQAMRLKFKFDDGKGALFAAILDGKLSVIGRQASGLCGLMLDRGEVVQYIAKLRSKAFGDAVTPTEVGKMLYCDPLVVPALLANGYLEGYRYEAGLRITRVSVQKFGADYRSVAVLAKARQTSSRSLTHRLQSAGIELLMMERPYGKGPQPFIHVADIEKCG